MKKILYNILGFICLAMAYTGVVTLDSAFSISLSVEIIKLIYSDVVTHQASYILSLHKY